MNYRIRYHGTTSEYANHACRCAACRKAWRKYCAAWRARRREQGLVADDPRHGSSNAYVNYGCRCRPCTDAKAAVQREQREQRARRGRT